MLAEKNESTNTNADKRAVVETNSMARTHSPSPVLKTESSLSKTSCTPRTTIMAGMPVNRPILKGLLEPTRISVKAALPKPPGSNGQGDKLNRVSSSESTHVSPYMNRRIGFVYVKS